MVVSVLRSRLREDGRPDYFQVAPKMGEPARTMPDDVSHKVFVAEDGGRVTVVEFADEASQRNWATNAEHVTAEKIGRESFYSEYKLQACSVLKESGFPSHQLLAVEHGKGRASPGLFLFSERERISRPSGPRPGSAA